MFSASTFIRDGAPVTVTTFRAETEADESQRHLTHRVQVINSSSEDLLVHTAREKK